MLSLLILPQTLLSWIEPLLIAPPAYAKRSSSTLTSHWQLLLLASNPTGELLLSGRERVALHALDDVWHVEAQLVSSQSPRVGVCDSVIQSCLSYCFGLHLHGQGWVGVGGRYVRLPALCAPSKCVPAVKCDLTLTQQRELTVYINVTHVQFNSIVIRAGRDVDDFRCAEQIVSAHSVCSCIAFSQTALCSHF